MGKDRQQKKIKEKEAVESDRDQSLTYPGSTKLESADAARERNK